MKREVVYAIIDSERDYQDTAVVAKYRRSELDKTVAAELVLMRTYLDKAFKAWTDNPGDIAALDVIRKVTAIGVRCIERHGAPMRGMG